ncbi:hypothetical protein DPMN_055665 [Dreissena polymorpha]|uniref:Uncharacterized protein n=1 Tax=Dreissena polymorpha TaxID=45954 RepID=A0A9D4HQU6_DREPO|nr:hypothetical protein DPMN_055665 [Dreissena polymorpha]
MSIKLAFGNRASGPYKTPMRVCIVAVDEEPSTFRGKDGTERKVLACAVSDGCKVVRVVCYASNLFGRLKVCQLPYL